jgi:hypothetical protein
VVLDELVEDRSQLFDIPVPLQSVEVHVRVGCDFVRLHLAEPEEGFHRVFVNILAEIDPPQSGVESLELAGVSGKQARSDGKFSAAEVHDHVRTGPGRLWTSRHQVKRREKPSAISEASVHRLPNERFRRPKALTKEFHSCAILCGEIGPALETVQSHKDIVLSLQIVRSFQFRCPSDFSVAFVPKRAESEQRRPRHLSRKSVPNAKAADVEREMATRLPNRIRLPVCDFFSRQTAHRERDISNVNEEK